MKCIPLLRVLDAVSGISFNRGFRTGATLSGRRERGARRGGCRKPDIKHKNTMLPRDPTLTLQVEDEEDLEENLDIKDINEVYHMNEREKKWEREKLGRILTMKNFFKRPQEPQTLTSNEKDCIKYLHRNDPVQWDINTLSESFPATPEAIKRVLKTQHKCSADLKKKLDLKVEKNWKLLAEGKLEASPEVLEHLKKFINRREVLLEQINNANFYLPEIKEEVVWNNGEMSNILAHYEKAIRKLAQKQELRDVKLLHDCSEKNQSNTEKNSSLDLVHEQIHQFKEKNNVNNKDSFTLGKMIKTYSKPLTMEELKITLLEKADNKETPLSLTEKAIVESTFNRNKEQKFNTDLEMQSFASEKKHGTLKEHQNDKDLPAGATLFLKQGQKNSSANKHKVEELMTREEEIKKSVVADSRTRFVNSDQLGKVLNEISNKGKTQSSLEKPEEDRLGVDAEVEKDSDVSDAGFLCEKQYFDNQVKEFENTAFWNKGSQNQDKVLAKTEKVTHGRPDNFARGNVYSNDIYPERIEIPKNKQGSGLTFRVKDCYYDDDGEFLYRVPGMVK